MPHTLQPPAPRPAVLRLALAAAGLGFGACVGLALTAETRSQLRMPGGVAMFLGNVTGLAGTYLALLMVLLVSRIPAVERVVGQDGLLRWHRRLSPWPISLILLHAVLLTYAYAEAAKVGILKQLSVFVASYSGMLLALVAFGIFLAIATLSIYSVRRRFRRETWWALHLGMYLVFALAFLHEVVLGPSFVGHPLTTVVWAAAWAATAGLVLLYRVGLPLYRSLYHGLRVVEVRPEAAGVASIILQGRHLDRLKVAGGQFFEWRFLTPQLFWQAHPYSLSARPMPPYLRLTVKALGDHSRAVHELPPGTRVLIEGPYGAFTSGHRSRRKVAVVTAGVGITAVRSLLEDLDPSAAPVVVWRVGAAREAPLESEVRELLGRTRGTLHVVAGPRSEFHLGSIFRLIPDLGRRDVYVSGPESFVSNVVALLEQNRVARVAIHAEAYAL